MRARGRPLRASPTASADERALQAAYSAWRQAQGIDSPLLRVEALPVRVRVHHSEKRRHVAVLAAWPERTVIPPLTASSLPPSRLASHAT